MSIEVLFERIAVALEKIAANTERVDTVVEEAKPARTRKGKPATEQAPEPETPVMSGAEAEKALFGHQNPPTDAAPAAAETPATPSSDAPAPQPTIAPSPEPTPAPEPVTIEQLQELGHAFVKAGGKRQDVLAIYSQFGDGKASKLAEIDAAHFPAVRAAFESAIAALKKAA